VAGVPQGSPISPLCFSLFIDDMTEVLEVIIAGRGKCFLNVFVFVRLTVKSFEIYGAANIQKLLIGPTSGAFSW
jgi:hypothetical protein